jgi:phage tail-like protein
LGEWPGTFAPGDCRVLTSGVAGTFPSTSIRAIAQRCDGDEAVISNARHLLPRGALMTTSAVSFTASRFSIVIDTYEIASFSDLAGVVSEIEPVAYLESDAQTVDHSQLLGKPKPPMVTLKRGMNASMELWAWHEAALKGDITAARRSCSLIMYDAGGKSVAKYWLESAWPSKIDISAMKAGASEVMYETVTLVCEYIQRVAP